MRNYRVALLALADAYAEHRRVSRSRIGTLARHDGKFFARLEKGGSCTVDVYCDLVEWFDARWPDKVPWPAAIARPSAPAKPSRRRTAAQVQAG
jgi:hypothetical protein